MDSTVSRGSGVYFNPCVSVTAGNQSQVLRELTHVFLGFSEVNLLLSLLTGPQAWSLVDGVSIIKLFWCGCLSCWRLEHRVCLLNTKEGPCYF